MKVDDVHNVLEEAPGKLAKSILLFTKGLGWLTSVDLPNVERRSSRDSIGGRRMSMEEFDKPNIRRLSLTGAKWELFLLCAYPAIPHYKPAAASFFVVHSLNCNFECVLLFSS